MKKNHCSKMGRPKLPAGTANIVLFAFKTTANAVREIETAARRSGMKTAEWARAKLLAAARRA